MSKSLFHHVSLREVGRQVHNPPQERSFLRSCCGFSWIPSSLHSTGKLAGHRASVNAATFSACGDFLLTGADDAEVKLWSYQTQTCQISLRGHTSRVSTVCFVPYHNCEEVLSGSTDCDVRRFNVQRNVCTVYAHHTSAVSQLSFNAYMPAVFLTCSIDGTVRQFDTRLFYQGCEQQQVEEGTADEYRNISRQLLPPSAATHRDVNRDVSRGTGSTKSSLLLNYHDRYGHGPSALTSLQCHPIDGYKFIVGGADGCVRLFDLRRIERYDPNSYVNLYAHGTTPGRVRNEEVRSCCFNYNGSDILVSTSDDEIYLYDANQSAHRNISEQTRVDSAVSQPQEAVSLPSAHLPLFTQPLIQVFESTELSGQSTGSLSVSSTDTSPSDPGSIPLATVLDSSAPMLPSATVRIDQLPGDPLDTLPERPMKRLKSDNEETFRTSVTEPFASRQSSVDTVSESASSSCRSDSNSPSGYDSGNDETTQPHIRITHPRIRSRAHRRIGRYLERSAVEIEHSETTDMFSSEADEVDSDEIQVDDNISEEESSADETLDASDDSSSGPDSGVVELQFPQSNGYRQRFLGHHNSTNVCFFGQRSEFVVSTSANGQVFVWDRQTEKVLRILHAHSSQVRSVSAHPLLPVLLTAAEDAEIKLWQAPVSSIPSKATLHKRRRRDVRTVTSNLRLKAHPGRNDNRF